MSSGTENYISTSKGESSKEGILMHSYDFKKDLKSSPKKFSATKDCLFCGDSFKKNPKQQFTNLVNKALYNKYSSSQNYYYTKDVNEILAETRTTAVILFKDYLPFDEEEEYLKRFYQLEEYDFKIKMLTEYYKFHNEIPRIFMVPITQIVNKFHDKKRRLEYVRVTNMLKVEQGIEEEPPAENNQHENFVITDRILDDLKWTEPDSSDSKTNFNAAQSEHLYFSKKATGKDGKETPTKIPTEKYHQAFKSPESKKLPQKNQKAKAKEVSGSSTLQDINLKLGEIISNSRSNNLESNYLENNESLPSETISNLDSFLVFLKKNPSVPKPQEVPVPQIKKQPPKKIISAPLTERHQRPESAMVTSRTKQTPRGEEALRASSSLVKNTSPIATKASVKPTTKSRERSKEQSDERSLHPSPENRPNKSSSQSARPKSGMPISKIKNFEEAFKVNPHIQHQKMPNHSSAPREHHEKNLSPSTSKNRPSSRTPSKQAKEKYSDHLKLKHQPSISSTSKSTLRSKTKSNDIYTKTLDLLLGNQTLLNHHKEKREVATQSHKSSKNSFNFKTKTPSQILSSHHEKSLGKDADSGLSSLNMKLIPNRVSSDCGTLHTDRVSKKSGLVGFDLNKKEMRQAPLTERQFSKDSAYRSKEVGNKSSRKNLKVSILTQSETENMKPEFIPYVGFNKLGLHKYTKSESRMKKLKEREEAEVPSRASSIMSNKKLKSASSPQKQNSPIKYSNNMASVFPSSSVGKRAERSPSLKTERQPNQEGTTHRVQSASKAAKSRSPSSELLMKFHQSLIKQLNGVNPNRDFKNLDLSPLRIHSKEGSGSVTRNTPLLTSRSPVNFNTGLQHPTPSKKEMEMIKKSLKMENFENLQNQGKGHKINNFFK